ncbi:organic solvent tolerance protein OstA [Metabacillus sp. B2-18]|uniref:organic solvent tolerance protein OstA n=1 Tax=Metabacillus sp. B2-18 TaxID=2897333 RepID=UPI001E34498A|nr:organic solvent tolerance protein OstA [Metabacillus sp. B2-18]UGB31682.1 organic solvent tolerance protein OstA [Metabacillus sp. B2-18]
MAKVQLNQKEQHYADTREEAEEIVTDAKANDSLIMNKISEKYNKYGQYFLVDLTYQENTPKEVMESKRKNDSPEGQLSIEDHEGIEYTVDESGSVEVSKDQTNIDDEESEAQLQRVK